MMIRKPGKITISILLLCFVISSGSFLSCKKKKEEIEEEEATFDKGPLLSNIADNLIIPQYAEFSVSLDSLSSAWQQFKTQKSITHLQNLRQQFKNTCLAWQRVSAFEFGPAETELMRVNVNTFPTDTVQIQSNFSAGTWVLGAAANTDAKGLPALDYLFNRLNLSDAAVVSSFTQSDSLVKAQYVEDVMAEIKAKANTIHAQWTGTYRNTFVASTGNDIGSSFSMMVNQLTYDLELLKNAKVGIPLGKMTLGIALPEKTEAYYGKFSLQLVQANLLNIENFYRGRSLSGNDGQGCDDYLVHIDAQHSAGPLNTVILNQFSICQTKLALLADPLSGEVVNNQSAVDAAYVEIQKLVVYLKTDMCSNLGIIITYQDADGD